MIRDVVVAGMAGFVATKLMEPVPTKLYELESPRAGASAGGAGATRAAAYRIAARKSDGDGRARPRRDAI